MDNAIIHDALLNAAGSDAPERRRRGSFVTTHEPSARRIYAARELITRFVSDLPDDMTVLEIREGLEQGSASS